MSDAVVHLSFPARAEYLILARLALAGMSRAVAIPEETLADLKLAVTEACGNAVRHAYADDQSDGVVRVAIEASDREIVIAVEDDGIGPQSRASGDGEDPDSGEVGESGMGLAIIEAIADQLQVGPATPQGGTRLTLRKQL
jgi:serine/threonine-protein kinase RsbW